MYRNLAAEMARYNVSKADVAKVLGQSYNHTREKLLGRYPFLLGEAFKVQEELFPDLDIKYLFKEFSEKEV